MRWIARVFWVIIILVALALVYLASTAPPWFGQ